MIGLDNLGVIVWNMKAKMPYKGAKEVCLTNGLSKTNADSHATGDNVRARATDNTE